MKTFINQSLIDSGDPLALSMLEQGGKPFKMVPLSEWDWQIFKVSYFKGFMDDDAKPFRVAYMISTPTHIEDDCHDMNENHDWAEWDSVEKLKGFNGRGGSYGLFSSIENLKERYRL